MSSTQSKLNGNQTFSASFNGPFGDFRSAPGNVRGLPALPFLPIQIEFNAEVLHWRRDFYNSSKAFMGINFI